MALIVITRHCKIMQIIIALVIIQIEESSILVFAILLFVKSIKLIKVTSTVNNQIL